MKKLILTIMLLLLPIACFAQGSDPKDIARNERSPLTLTIKSDKEVYEAGEEIDITVSIKNISPEGLYLYAYKLSYFMSLDIKTDNIKGLSVTEYKMPQDWFHVPENKDFIFLAPNEIHSVDLNDLSAGNMKYNIENQAILKAGVGLHLHNLYHHSPHVQDALVDGSGVGIKAFTGDVLSDTIIIKVVEKRQLSDKTKAREIAEDYISKQYYKDAYENKAHEVVENKDYFEVFFHRKNRSVEQLKGEGRVRVDKKTWIATWVPGM